MPFGLDLKSIILGVLFALFVYPMILNAVMGMRRPVTEAK